MLAILLSVILSTIYITALGFSRKECLKMEIEGEEVDWPLLYIHGPLVYIWNSLYLGVVLSCSEEIRQVLILEEMAVQDILDEAEENSDDEEETAREP